MRIRIGATLAALVLFVPGVATAQLQVGVDVDAVFPTGEELEGDTGFGIAGRIGVGLPTPAIDFVPELSVGYAGLGAPAIAEGVSGDDVDRLRDLDLSVVRAMVGARLGWGEILRPTLFAHVGYGRVNVGEDETFFERRGGFGEESALSFDAGLAFDLTILPLIDVGVHGAYNLLDTERALEWWSAGVHAALRL
jgi:hypothetical protein